MEKYLIKVNETEFEMNKEEVTSLDVQQITDTNFHVLKDRKAYEIQLVKADFPNRTLTVSVNGNSYRIRINDSYDQLVEKMGLLSNASQKAKNILAPMPGLIMNIMVATGQEILEGTPLLVLSAMKMENQILSQGAGKIKSIEVKVGDTVDKGQLIIEMDS